MTDSKNTKPATTEAKAPEPTVEVLSLREQKLKDMANPSSDLRNQEGVENIVDFQLLSNTPAEMIQAMTGWSIEQLADRAKQLETTLKGSLAGTMNK
jgi:hypothetical protein